MQPLLERVVMKCSPVTDREIWENASPVARIHERAPHFMVIHGTHDSLAFVEDARIFVDALRDKSQSKVLYAEIPDAQHAFDIFHSVRCDQTVAAQSAFFERIHTHYRGEHTDGQV